MMKLFDPTLELAACGSSGRSMPSFGAWEDTVLEHTFEHVDFISLHTYLNDYAGDTAGDAGQRRSDGRLHRGGGRDRRRGRGARRVRRKRIMLSFDEWNVWYRTRRARDPRTRPTWPVAPPILEEVYSLADALAFGGICISLLNHADRVKVACLAQLVNAIAPIMTETGGAGVAADDLPSVRADEPLRPRPRAARRGRRADVRGDLRRSGGRRAALVRAARGALPQARRRRGSHGGRAHAVRLNRHLEAPLAIEIGLVGWPAFGAEFAWQLTDDDLDAANTRDEPERVVPTPLRALSVSGDRLRVTLAPASWNVIRLQRAA